MRQRSVDRIEFVLRIAETTHEYLEGGITGYIADAVEHVFDLSAAYDSFAEVSGQAL